MPGRTDAQPQPGRQQGGGAGGSAPPRRRSRRQQGRSRSRRQQGRRQPLKGEQEVAGPKVAGRGKGEQDVAGQGRAEGGRWVQGRAGQRSGSRSTTCHHRAGSRPTTCYSSPVTCLHRGATAHQSYACTEGRSGATAHHRSAHLDHRVVDQHGWCAAATDKLLARGGGGRSHQLGGICFARGFPVRGYGAGRVEGAEGVRPEGVACGKDFVRWRFPPILNCLKYCTN